MTMAMSEINIYLISISPFSCTNNMHLKYTVPTGSGETPRVVTVQPHIIFIGVAILVTMVLLLLIASIPVGCCIIRRLVSTPEYT